MTAATQPRRFMASPRRAIVPVPELEVALVDLMPAAAPATPKKRHHTKKRSMTSTSQHCKVAPLVHSKEQTAWLRTATADERAAYYLSRVLAPDACPDLLRSFIRLGVRQGWL